MDAQSIIVILILGAVGDGGEVEGSGVAEGGDFVDVDGEFGRHGGIINIKHET